MRKELELIGRIERYLLNELSGAEKLAFETELNQNTELQENLTFQKNLMTAIRKVGARKSAKKARKKYKVQKLLKQIGLGIAIAGAAAAAAYYFLSSEEEVDNTVEFHQPIAFTENDTLSAAANQYLDQEVFAILTNQDTVIETEDGVVVSIPAGAFDTDKESVDLVMQTAVQSDDILKAGLSTTSNGEELETGGMFYMDAFADNERVNLQKNLTVDVPANQKQTGMQLYEGEKMPNGEINWVTPKPVETFLTAVNIEVLDFYPPGYESTLNNWGLYGKEFRDSLYFSFAFDQSGMDFCEKLLLMGPPKRKLTAPERDFLYGDNRPIDRLMTREEAEGLCEMGMFSRFAGIEKGDPVIGEKLFNGNCASCHFPDRDMTGPALTGARRRWMQNSTEENFYKWIKNSQSVIKSGDEYANQLFEAWNGSVMTPQTVTNEQIDHIFAYVEVYSYAKNGSQHYEASGGLAVSELLSEDVNLSGMSEPLLGEGEESIWYEGDSIEMVDSTAAIAATEAESAATEAATIIGVNPASVQTIWNSAFTKTNLATKAFEERMPFIHQSCETNVLNVYVEYLDRPLYYSDSIAATMTSGVLSDQFKSFAARRDGRVSGSDEAQSLYAYYEKKRKANATAVQKTQANYWNEQGRKNQHLASEENESSQRNNQNKSTIFAEEFKVNLEKAKKDLGIPTSTPRTNSNSYTVSVSNLGWKNIDRPVREITNSRETGTVSYEGREAKIEYESWSAAVSNYSSYDKVNVYNIPKNLNSYIKLDGKEGKYAYQLNANLDYQTLVLAWTENSIFFFQDKKTTQGEHNISLKPITLDEFKNNVAASLTPVANMEEELNYIEYAQKDQAQVNKNEDKRRLKERILPVIFPCMQREIGAVPYSTEVGHGDHHSEEHH